MQARCRRWRKRYPSRFRRGLVTLVLLALYLASSPAVLFAQNISGIVNTYAEVLAIDTCANTATLVSTSGFSPGDRVLIIQMKGATIDTTNTASYGTIQTLGSAGLCEIATIESIPDLTTVQFRNKLVNRYDTWGAVQLVRIPHYGDVTISDTLRAAPWNPITGTGGVLIIEASGSITVRSTIDVSGLGFYGGAASQNGTSDLPSDLEYVVDACSTQNGAVKGEGIASDLRFGEFCEGGRGAPIDGGGGGNSHNAGGAGGAGASGGGRGGDQTDAPGFGRVPNGGEPGSAPPWFPNRMFMGGGGGGGHQNDALGTNGGSGGGIVILKAPAIYSDSEIILANGTAPGRFWAGKRVANIPDTAYSDGAGGGGGGGTIWLDANSIIATGGHTNALMCEVRGGTGGNADAQNGPYGFGTGGGGGGGLVAAKTVGAFTPDLLGGNAGNIVHSTDSSINNLAYGAGDGKPGTSEDTLYLPEDTVPYITPGVANHSATICNGDTTLLSASGGDSYLWSPSVGMSNPTSESVRVSPAATTTYTVQIGKGACFVTDTVNVTVLPLPAATFNGPSMACSGSTETYWLNPQPGLSYAWTVTGGTPVIGSGDSLQVTWDTAGTQGVSLRVTNGSCSDSTGEQITVEAPIAPVIDATKLVLANIGDTSVLSLSRAYTSYLWSTGETTSTITVDSAGIYTVAVVDSNGCSGTDSIQINYPATLPSIELALPDISAKPGEHVILPVNIIASQNLGSVHATDFTYTLHYDRSLLVPLDPATTSTFNNGMRYVTKHGTLSNQLSTNSLDQIEFLATLGDTTETTIYFDTIIWGSGKPMVSKLDSGHFTLLNVCPAGGNQLFLANGTTGISNIRPNPISGIAVADYSLVEPGFTSVEILDMLGRSVLTVSSGDAKPGTYHVVFDASPLPNGIYNLVLRTPSQVFMKQLEVYH